MTAWIHAWGVTPLREAKDLDAPPANACQCLVRVKSELSLGSGFAKKCPEDGTKNVGQVCPHTRLRYWNVLGDWKSVLVFRLTRFHQTWVCGPLRRENV